MLNYLLPQQGVLSMHCSANVGQTGDTAIFFGLSGTGKTTLSADPVAPADRRRRARLERRGRIQLRGRLLRQGDPALAPTGEPEIYAATRMFGTVLENVVLDPVTRAPDFDSDKLTENTRASYPIDFIPNHKPDGAGGHPENIIFLTADAFGVLPPIARLTPEQAMYHFLSGYTAKVAGTERGVTEPSATFSSCFGAPFLPAAPRGVRPDARRADREARRPGLAGEHRMDRRRVWNRIADEAGAHPRHGDGGAVRGPRHGHLYERSGLRNRGTDLGSRSARGGAHTPVDLARSRRIRRAGKEAGGDVSARISRRLRRRCPVPSRTRGRSCRET